MKFDALVSWFQGSLDETGGSAAGRRAFCLLLFAACFTLTILPYWSKAIIPARLVTGALAIILLWLYPPLRRQLWRTPAFYAMAGYAIACFVSALVNGIPLRFSGTALAWLGIFLAFWCLGSVLGEKARLPFILMGLGVLFMLAGYLLLGQEGLGLIDESAFQGGGDRIVGTFKSQGNRLAVLLATSAFLCMGGGFAAKDRSARWGLWCMALLLFFFLINSGTRTWTAMFFCASGLYLATRKVPVKYLVLAATAVVALIIGLYCLGAPQMQNYFNVTRSGGQSALSRLPMWQLAWDLFLQHPLFGVGPEQFREFYAAHYAANLGHLPPAERLFAIPTTTHAHNIFLSPLAESGLAGALSLAACLFFSIRSGLSRPGLLRDAALLLLIIVIVGMLNPALGREPGTVLAAVAGLAAAVHLKKDI